MKLTTAFKPDVELLRLGYLLVFVSVGNISLTRIVNHQSVKYIWSHAASLAPPGCRIEHR
jgi:hypothetical protein